MKAKKRFNTANDIRDEIDRCKKKAVELAQQAETLERKAGHLRQCGPEFEEDAKYAEIEAKKCRTSSSRLQTEKLQILKNKLSEWMNPQLPALDNGDPSIPA